MPYRYLVSNCFSALKKAMIVTLCTKGLEPSVDHDGFHYDAHQ